MENSVIRSYLADIQRYPLLSAAEECDLSEKINASDESAYKKLVNCNLRLVVSVALRIAHNAANSVSEMDLIQEGSLGLMVAARKFSPAFGTRFSTYAYPWIAQYMLRYINTKTAFISIPHRKEALIRSIQKASSYLSQLNGTAPSVSDIALYLGIPAKRVNECMSFAYSYSSLESCPENNCTYFGDSLPSDVRSPEEEYLRDETCAELRNLMGNLGRNEGRVLWYRFNFDGSTKAKTLREIGSIIGVSPEAVRQTEIRAVRHIREYFENAV